MRKYLVFGFLWSLGLVSRLFWRCRIGWIGTEAPRAAWSRLRLVCFLNHTSLFEWIFVAAPPTNFLWRVACHGVVPAAAKTITRPVVGRFFKLLAANVVSISRERDHTWREVLSRIDPDSMVLILPEGRMKRPNGLDSNGQPMSVRGGIADILEAIPSGEMVIAYSGGLHHVQAPGERLPRLFRTIRMNFELVEIAAYRAERLAEAGSEAGFKRAVVDDLERRRDLHCPPAS
ncbi:MAG: 1-acyl-sn-glycerol-3-phosphate acyltransferase [Thermoanaerobaculia bacterium]